MLRFHTAYCLLSACCRRHHICWGVSGDQGADWECTDCVKAREHETHMSLSSPARRKQHGRQQQRDKKGDQTVDILEHMLVRVHARTARARHDLPVPAACVIEDPVEEVAVLMVSDWQIGKRTETYNSHVAERRMLLYAQEALKICRDRQLSHKIDVCHIWLLGDVSAMWAPLPARCQPLPASDRSLPIAARSRLLRARIFSPASKQRLIVHCNRK